MWGGQIVKKNFWEIFQKIRIHIVYRNMRFDY